MLYCILWSSVTIDSCCQLNVAITVYGRTHTHRCMRTIDIKKVDKQLTHAMHVKDRHVNDTFIDKLTKWYQ